MPARRRIRELKAKLKKIYIIENDLPFSFAFIVLLAIVVDLDSNCLSVRLKIRILEHPANSDDASCGLCVCLSRCLFVFLPRHCIICYCFSLLLV